MAMNLIDNERLRIVCRDFTGHAHSDAGAIAELARNELWARKVVTRRTLLDRIVTLAQPLVEVEKEVIQGILDEMEKNGDITTGPRGALAAAPLRVVSAGDGRYRIFGTLPNRFFPATKLVGTVREITDDAGDQIAELLCQYGGVKLSAERWAGFDRVQPAGPDWLKCLDARLESEACEPALFDNEVNGTWMVFRPIVDTGKSSSRWKKPAENDDGRQWKGWSYYGWPIHLWTGGGSPSKVPSLRLTSDEAARTTFALAMDACSPIVIRANVIGTDVALSCETFLPIAEYRYLITIGEVQDVVETKRAFKVPLEIWPQVDAKLKERLGVIIEGTGV